MNFSIARTTEVLEATPGVIRSLLGGLSDDWTRSSGERDRWEAFDILGHLIHGEATDWIPRARIILGGAAGTFEPFDRWAQFKRPEGSSLPVMLDEFEGARQANLAELRSWKLSDEQLEITGTHPELGTVTLRQLLATWAVHDLNHIAQTARVLARRYAGEVGPWKAYLSILDEKI
jgi:hypothetical protein